MEENQTNQNLNQQPVQPVQTQPEQVQQPVQQQSIQNQQQVQQPVQGQPAQQQSVEQPSVSMQIQQLLVQQQQYQQQYNQLVDYVKKTPNLPIEQINQIKQQLDYLNALFVQGKQQLQALGYSSVQVKKPTNVKKGSKDDFSFKKFAIGCFIALALIFLVFFVTLRSLIKNPSALMWIGIEASTAQLILKAFTIFLFGSIILLLLGIIVGSIYRLITIKNKSRLRSALSLASGVIGLIIVGTLMGLVWLQLGKIKTTPKPVTLSIIQPYLIGKVEKVGDEFNFPYNAYNLGGNQGFAYPLIAPSEFVFSVRSAELFKYKNKFIGADTTIKSLVLVCDSKNSNSQRLGTSVGDVQRFLEGNDILNFDGRCLYGQKGTYNYMLEIYYKHNIRNYNGKKTIIFTDSPLTFYSDVSIYATTSKTSSSSSKTSRVLPANGEFNLGKVPSKTTIDTTNVFLTYKLPSYEVEVDMDGDGVNDRINQVTFNYSYLIPQVYYPTIKFPKLNDFVYAFPVRLMPSDVPVCWIRLYNYPGTRKYQITSEFTDPADAAKISSYNYTIKNESTRKTAKVYRNYPQEFNLDFPEQGSYSVALDYVTVDGKQGWCESDVIQMKKWTFDIQYSMLNMNSSTSKFKEICNSKSTAYSGCTQIKLDTLPQTYQLQIKSIAPSSNTLKKKVTLNGAPLLNENDTYKIEILDEGVYDLVIAVSDVGRGMAEEYRSVRFVAKKPDIVGNMIITTAESDPKQRKYVTEGFEPLTVIIDASKTEVNVNGDEIIYFTWDFGDGEIKRNQQNAIVAHTYNYDYVNENGIFTPKVKIRTRSGIEKVINGRTINVKKGLLTVDIASTSHPSGQAPIGRDVTFSAEFDGLPEKMTWDFGDGSDPVSCKGRTCTEITHTFEKAGVFSIKLSLDFDAVQQVDGTMDFKIF